MKFIKRVGILFLIFLLTGLIFREWVYRHLITYKTIGDRLSYTAKEPALFKYISSNDHLQETEVSDIIKLSLKLTSKHIHFTSGINDRDPNQLVISENANCIGYAAFFSTVCNKLLAQHHLNEHWTAKPKAGQIYFLGTNIHSCFKSTFFKDHDIVIIENSSTGEVLAVDPSLYDYTGLEYVHFLPH